MALVAFADIRKSSRPFLEDKTEDDFFQIDVRTSLPNHFLSFICLFIVMKQFLSRLMRVYLQVRVCSGKPMTVVASRKGFYPAGKRLLLSHTLVGLLQQNSRIFDAVSLSYVIVMFRSLNSFIYFWSWNSIYTFSVRQFLIL